MSDARLGTASAATNAHVAEERGMEVDDSGVRSGVLVESAAQQTK